MHRSERIGIECEHKATKAAILLTLDWPFVIGCYHPIKNKEIDSCGIDLILFLRNGFVFFVQVKASTKSLKEHWHKYPYIFAVSIEEHGKRLPETFRERIILSRRSFEKPLRSPMASREKHVPPEADDSLSILLKEKSPVFSRFHRALPGEEMKRIGMDGLVFLQNGMGIFIREKKNKIKPKAPYLLIDSIRDEQRVAREVAQAITTKRGHFFLATPDDKNK